MSKHEFLIVGAGAGGATLARELSRRGRRVLVVEQGTPESSLGTYRDGVRCYDCNKITQIPKHSVEGVTLWRAFAAGGSTLVSCGNGVPALIDELADLGIALDEELAEVTAELQIAPIDEALLSEGSRALRQAAHTLGYRMDPMPKFIDAAKCIRCGNCVLGCRTGARWTSERYLQEAQAQGGEVRYGAQVRRVLVEGEKARGVEALGPEGALELQADAVILAAGGLSTPVVLQNSGVEAGEGLFIDLMINVYGVTQGLNQINEPQMALVNREFHAEEGFLLSPYVSHPRRVRFLEIGPQGYALPTRRLLGLMVKIVDEASGRVHPDGSVSKAVTEADARKLERGAAIAREILVEAGVDERSLTQTKPAGAHPGGTAAVGRVVGSDLQTRVPGLFVCDASVLPAAPGAPPIVTLVALAKRLAKTLTE
ncbi:MAG: FAD-dependent oxidoreductase [Anaerolineales bacterium]